MNDWDVFTASVTWFLKPGSRVHVGERRTCCELSSAAAVLFPRLSELLSCAQITPVVVDESRYELFAWNGRDGYRTGWLCMPACEQPPDNLHESHKILITSFGGIVERFNEPGETWLLNLNDALTAREAAHDGSFIEEYASCTRIVGLNFDVPIIPQDYYSIAREANGNTTLCHRKTGEVIMFAPDHCFRHLTVLGGCPEYTLYTVNDASTFRDWVEVIARQWLAQINAVK